MRSIGWALLVLAGVVGSGCHSDNVSWVFVSNPSGDDPFPKGGAVIIIRASSSTSNASIGGDFVQATGDDGGPVTVHLAVGAELAIVERARSLELRAPVMAADALELPGAIATFSPSPGLAVDIRVLDASLVDPAAGGPGRILCAAHGTLVVLEHAGGTIAFGAEQPRHLPAGTTVEDRQGALIARLPDGRIERLVARPAPPARQHARRPHSGRLELIGPRGTVIAALPESQCVLHGGMNGLFLTASFPGGLGTDPTPTSLTAADGNRYLLRVLGG